MVCALHMFCNGTRMIPEAHIVFFCPLFDIVHQMEGHFDFGNSENLRENNVFVFQGLSFLESLQ